MNNNHSSCLADLHAESLAKQDWTAALLNCAESRRLACFEQLATTPPYSSQMTDAAFRQTLRYLLSTLSDFARPNPVLRRLLLETRPLALRPTLMLPEEKRRLAQQPAILTVYQGRDASKRMDWIWSLSSRPAIWNAIRLSKGKPVVLEGTIKRSDVLMLSASLPQGNVLACPECVQVVREHTNARLWIASDALRPLS